MSDASEVQLRFVGGAANKDLETEISSILSELADPTSEVARSAVAVGLNPADMAGAQVSVEEEAKGFGPVSIKLMFVVPAAVAAHTINKFWEYVIFPRITKGHGADALGPPPGPPFIPPPPPKRPRPGGS